MAHASSSYIKDNGVIRIRPRFIGEVKIKDPEKDPGKRDNIMKRNLSYAYSVLFTTLYGGREIKLGDREKYQVMYGMQRDFTPDVVDYGKPFGYVWTEVKATSAKDKRPLFTDEQIEKYSLYLLDALDRGQMQPESQVAIFTYGMAQDKPCLVRLDNDKLRKKIANETRSLVILPLNLMFSIFCDPDLCTRPIFNHTSSLSPRNHQQYWRVYGRTISALNNGELDYFVNKVKKTKRWDKFATKNILHLDDLTVETSMFPDNVVLGKHRVQSFPVTLYKNSHPHIWLDSFWKNHKYILEEGLEVEDIFSKGNIEREMKMNGGNVIDMKPALFENEDGELVADCLPY